MVKRKFILLAIFNVITCTAFGQSHKFSYKSYKPLPAICRYRDSLFHFIKPDSPYIYWEHVHAFSPKFEKTIFSSGVKPAGIVFNQPKTGFFKEWAPISGFYYIAYAYKGQAGYITTVEQLIHFLGHIDNLQEAVLLAEISRVGSVDQNINPKGGSYRSSKDGYDLILTDYQPCPIWKSIRVIINSREIIKTTNLGIYHTEKGCPMP